MTRPSIRIWRWVGFVLGIALLIPAGLTTRALAQNPARPHSADGLGQLTGLLPRDHLTTESAIQVDLSKETVRLPLYKGVAPIPDSSDRSRNSDKTQTVWFILLDASDPGAGA